MSKYTTQVRSICEVNAGLTESVGFDSIDETITKAAPKIFNFDFPIFDEAYRLPLEIKILRHYYMREIGEETVGLWKLRLQDRLCMIMPYYNQLYKSELLEFNPLYDVDITREHNTKNNGSTDSTSNGKQTGTSNETNSNTGTDWRLYSDTPQGSIDNVENENYLSNITKDTTQSNGERTGASTVNVENTGNTTITNTEEYLETVKGKQGSKTYSALIQEYRKTFLNIDQKVIEELSDLFFGLWE